VKVRYRVVGDGPEGPRLRRLAASLGIAHVVEWAGPREPAAIGAELAAADVVVLGCRVARDGDRDGVPNALLEAMAAGVPVIACDAGGVNEVIEHGRTGWLVAPDDPRALALALDTVARDPVLRAAVGEGGRTSVQHRFAITAQRDVLAELLSATGG
jgi:glycosyltransferase involved in cell wall biosynthesis